MFPLIFQIPQLPDLKSQKYLSLYGQGVRQKVLSSQKDFLLLLSDIGRVYHLTFSIRYRYLPGLPFDQRLGIYLLVNQSPTNSSDTRTSADIEQIITQGFLSQFYQIEAKSQVPKIQNLNWVTHIGEAIKYEEIITAQQKMPAEIFHRLAGDLRFFLNPIPEKVLPLNKLLKLLHSYQLLSV